jgi:hypothetical protein
MHTMSVAAAEAAADDNDDDDDDDTNGMRARHCTAYHELSESVFRMLLRRMIAKRP